MLYELLRGHSSCLLKASTLFSKNPEKNVSSGDSALSPATPDKVEADASRTRNRSSVYQSDVAQKSGSPQKAVTATNGSHAEETESDDMPIIYDFFVNAHHNNPAALTQKYPDMLFHKEVEPRLRAHWGDAAVNAAQKQVVQEKMPEVMNDPRIGPQLKAQWGDQ